MNNFLITGGTGFIGSHTCLTLLENNYNLIVIDSLINSSEKVLDNIKYIFKKKKSIAYKNLKFLKGDLRNKNFINSIFHNEYIKGTPIQGVIHFAGLKSVPQSFSEPLNYWENNVYGTLNLLKAMEKYFCYLLVFSSTATVYGKNKNNLIKEEDICDPINPYGITKFAIEKLLNDLYLSNSSVWKIANLRYFNPIGAHPSGLIGESPLSFSSNIFPQINKVALGKKDKINIFGNDWPTSDGTCIRDYIHVMDLAQGHLLAMEYLLRSNSGIITLNLGTGKGTSVKELIEIFQDVNKLIIPYVFSPRRKGDHGIVVADNSLASSLFNWTPQRKISEMCKDGWEWNKNYPEGFEN